MGFIQLKGSMFGEKKKKKKECCPNALLHWLYVSSFCLCLCK